jgi:hypothetical protein
MQGVSRLDKTVTQRAPAGADLTQDLFWVKLQMINNTPNHARVMQKMLAKSLSRPMRYGIFHMSCF